MMKSLYYIYDATHAPEVQATKAQAAPIYEMMFKSEISEEEIQ